MTSTNSSHASQSERRNGANGVDKRPAIDGLTNSASGGRGLAPAPIDLEQYRRLAVLGSMATLFAHELNNVMTPILARTELALESNDPQFHRSALQKALVNAQRAIALSAKMLGISGPPTATPAHTDLAAVISRALEDLPRSFEKEGIEVANTLAPGISLRAPEELCGALFLNALLYLRDRLKGTRGTIHISARSIGNRVNIELKDSGPHIAQETLDATLNAFLRADPSSDPSDWESVGPNLAMCRWVASDAGASLRFEAGRDRGVSLLIDFPLA